MGQQPSTKSQSSLRWLRRSASYVLQNLVAPLSQRNTYNMEGRRERNKLNPLIAKMPNIRLNSSPRRLFSHSQCRTMAIRHKHVHQQVRQPRCFVEKSVYRNNVCPPTLPPPYVLLLDTIPFGDFLQSVPMNIPSSKQQQPSLVYQFQSSPRAILTTRTPIHTYGNKDEAFSRG